MKLVKSICLFGIVLLMSVSCAKSTEKYAQKEHGKKFGSWEMRYNAGDYDVYWPSLALSEVVKGGLHEVYMKRSWWTDEVLSRDTTISEALLKAKIYSVKSKNDALYFNSIYFKVCNAEHQYRGGLEHRFVFNEGQKDSLSFWAGSNDHDYFIPERAMSEQIIELLCGKKPVSIKVVSHSSLFEDTYTFVIDGCPALKNGLELNQKRKIEAKKEFDKAQRKADNALKGLFD